MPETIKHAASHEKVWTITPVRDTGWVVLGSTDSMRRIFSTRSEAIKFAHLQVMHARGGRIRIRPLDGPVNRPLMPA